MTSPLLTLEGFKILTAMPPEDVEGVEAKFPGYIAAKIAVSTSRMHARLAKRYATPFASPAPEIVLGWIEAETTPMVYRKRGWNPGDEQAAQIEQDRVDALAEQKEAADAENGLYDLPLRADNNASGISKGEPFGYSEASPYEWTDVQAEAIRGR